MKKHVLFSLFAFMGIMFAPSVFAFDSLDIQVSNVSQDDQDAMMVGAYPGDVLKFDIDVMPLDGPEEFLDVDIADVLQKTQIIDKGFGELQGDYLSFPVFDGSEMSFFVRVNENCSPQDATITVLAQSTSVQVDLFCGPTQTTSTPILPSTGSGTTTMVISIGAAMMILATLLFIMVNPKKD